LRPRHEKLDRGNGRELLDGQSTLRIGHAQRGNRNIVLAGETETATAGGQHLQPGTGAEQLGHDGHGIEEMFAIIKDQQDSIVAKSDDEICDERPLAALLDIELRRNCRRNERHFLDRSEWNEDDAVLEHFVGIYGQGLGEPCLADPSGPGQGKEANVVAREQATNRGQLLLPADQRIQRSGRPPRHTTVMIVRRPPRSRRDLISQG
jgi:hypothetical protein